ncbi:hypothetical protein [Streptomyces sp. V4I2]|uniref:hypothetical protein n=1 Tax=Streptomyces sp. V4I2 TaxID=3042280 RepID=UPI00359348A2
MAARRTAHVPDRSRSGTLKQAGTEFDPRDLSPPGGAIAIGHPPGAPGARPARAVAHQPAAESSSVGVATLCIGVGPGLLLLPDDPEPAGPGGYSDALSARGRAQSGES